MDPLYPIIPQSEPVPLGKNGLHHLVCNPEKVAKVEMRAKLSYNGLRGYKDLRPEKSRMKGEQSICRLNQELSMK